MFMSSSLQASYQPEFNVVFQLLAGADITAKTHRKETVLHWAAAKDHASICQVLIENGVDFDAVEENGNNGK